MLTFDYHPEDSPEEGGTYYPILVCDACGDQIVEYGNTYWFVAMDGTVAPGVWHTHKFPCSRYDDVIEAMHEQDGLVMSEEINMWLGQLSRNLHERVDR